MTNTKLTDYAPVFIVFGAAFAAALALWSYGAYFMPALMGMVLFVFATFKLVNIAGFAKGLQKYDPLAGRYAAFGFAVPFLEMGLALVYLGGAAGFVTHVLLLLYALYNAVTVRLALRRGLDVRCACLGTALNLPLSSVTFYENVFMAIMAVGMIV
jgi:hypothetical protein